MAAVVTATQPVHRQPPRPVAPARPPLRVLEGGRRGARAHALEQRRRRQPAAVYHRRRLLVAAATVAVVVVGFLAAIGLRTLVAVPAQGATTGAASSSSATPLAPARYYVVQPGDTLWSIAHRLHPSGDPRPLVDRLAARAGGASLQAGQRLRIDGLGG
jgi:hypothetical protein